MDIFIEILVQLLVFLVVAYVVFSFRSEIDETTAELRERQLESGSSTLSELYIQLSPEAFIGLRLVLAGSLFFIGALAGLFVAIVCALAGYIGPQLYLKRLRRLRVREVERQLVNGLELLGNALKSGLTIQQATELLVQEFPPPISQEFSLVLAESRLGVEYSEAVEKMARRLDSNVLSVLASSVAITKKCGGDLTEIFSNIASTIREQVTIEGKLEAVTAQGRFQGLILGAMPFLLLVALWFIDRAHVKTLFEYTIGNWAMGAVVIMVGVAQLWIRKLMSIDV